jgi:hypothetical protein
MFFQGRELKQCSNTSVDGQGKIHYSPEELISIFENMRHGRTLRRPSSLTHAISLAIVNDTPNTNLETLKPDGRETDKSAKETSQVHTRNRHLSRA